MEGSMQNIFRAFDQQLLSEAYDMPVDIAMKMQQENNNGIIVQCREDMSFLRPDEDEEEERQERTGRSSRRLESNGLEETLCTQRVRHNLNTRSESDIVSRQAGRIQFVNHHKLPILARMDMSAENGHLFPNAMYAPHWSMTDNRVVYVTRGEAQVQISDDNVQNVFDERVQRGDMFVFPQFYATMIRAESDGFEWVSFKTSSEPMKTPMVGYTSFMRALPVQVIQNAYEMSPREAEDLKMCRGDQTLLFSPSRRSFS